MHHLFWSFIYYQFIFALCDVLFDISSFHRSQLCYSCRQFIYFCRKPKFVVVAMHLKIIFFGNLIMKSEVYYRRNVRHIELLLKLYVEVVRLNYFSVVFLFSFSLFACFFFFLQNKCNQFGLHSILL